MTLYKRILLLISGAAGGQLILLLSTPVLSRLYTPEDFGYFATSTGVAIIFSAIAYFRYDAAILINDKKTSPTTLFHLSLLILIFSSVVFYTMLTTAQHFQFYTSIIPVDLSVFEMFFLFLMFSLSILLTAWHTRHNRFTIISSSKVILALAVVAFQYIGYTEFGGVGLIFGNIFGLLIVNVFLLYFVIKKDYKVLVIKFDAASLKECLITHKNFPKYSVFATLLNGLSNQLPSILFARTFGVAYAGFYSMASRFTRGPAALAGQSIFHVISAHVGNNATDIVEIRKTIVSTLSKMTHTAGPFLILGIFFIEDMFAFVLGEGWGEAGSMAKLFLPWIYVLYLSWPMTSVFNTLEKQQYVLIFNILFIVAIVFPFLLLQWLDKNGVILFMAFLGSVFRFAYIISALRLVNENIYKNIVSPFSYWFISMLFMFYTG